MVWAGSPMAGAAIAASIRRRRSSEIATEVRSHVTCQVTRRVANQVASRVSMQIRNDVMNHVASQVAGQVWVPVRQQIERHIERPVEGAGYGQHDAHVLAFYDALGQFGADVSELDGLTEISASCGWWWAFKDVCILTERHSRIERDERGRLHSAAGPAIVYPDGWSVYAWHGVGIAGAIIVRPETITVAQIQHEANVEVRRVLLERYGFDRYVTDSGALPIHADDTGTLYRCELDGDEPLAVVAVLNSTPEPDGSRKRYVLRVPPDMTEARQAVAWTFGQKADEYQPALET